MTISDLIPILSIALGIGGFFIGRLTAAKTEGRDMGILRTQLDQGLETIKELRFENSAKNAQNVQVTERLIKLELEMAAWWRKYDDLRGGS